MTWTTSPMSILLLKIHCLDITLQRYLIKFSMPSTNNIHETLTVIQMKDTTTR